MSRHGKNAHEPRALNARILEARLRRVRHFVLDMDGTIYKGGTVFGDTAPFLRLLKKLRLGYTFITNNSSEGTAEYLARLERLGVKARPDELYTSTQATIEFLRAQCPGCQRLFVLGTPSLAAELAAAGFAPIPDSAAEEPDAVVVGFDTTLTYARLCRAAWWIASGKPFIATHPDRTCPTDQPTVLVDCGAICSALRAATGRAPDAVLGKPDPCMVRGVLQRHQLSADQLAVVGDRLYTDIVMAREAGALGVLVLTGETTPDEAQCAAPPPDLIVSGLGELGALLSKIHGTSTK
ncbi:MAG: HAD-IIA family hydrolase [Verrucomicrobiae bacterium]|nr:HAD-IIA family hydrolase [Verrucomicrobiae bacterium]MDW7980936.1 HAD-IIA family hydrolase [Verrucomicrobiales bacterium]